VATAPTTFWDDLAADLKDPEFLRAYVLESLRIETIDRLVNELDSARLASGLSKAELARAISAEPATVRRLLSPGHRNPTIGTLTEAAAALGLRLTFEPMPEQEREQVVRPLRCGVVHDPESLVRSMEQKRAPQREDGCLV